MKKVVASIALNIIVFSLSTGAQEEARAIWQVTNFDITATPQPAERALSAVAVLTPRMWAKARRKFYVR